MHVWKLSRILFDLKSKYRDSHVLIAGDFNEAPDDALDVFPPRISVSKNYQLLCDNPQVIDAWRFLHPHNKEYTWNNNAFTHKSRIDFWLLSANAVQFFSDISIGYSPLSDHRFITISLTGSTDSCKRIRGYWKFNNKLLSDKKGIEMVVNVASIFEDDSKSHTQRWEVFKLMVRQIAMRRGKELKEINRKKSHAILDNLDKWLSKDNLDSDEEATLLKLRKEIDDLYLDLVKGAFIRSGAKWLEMGNKIPVIFMVWKKEI